MSGSQGNPEFAGLGRCWRASDPQYRNNTISSPSDSSHTSSDHDMGDFSTVGPEHLLSQLDVGNSISSVQVEQFGWRGRAVVAKDAVLEHSDRSEQGRRLVTTAGTVVMRYKTSAGDDVEQVQKEIERLKGLGVRFARIPAELRLQIQEELAWSGGKKIKAGLANIPETILPGSEDVIAMSNRFEADMVDYQHGYYVPKSFGVAMVALTSHKSSNSFAHKVAELTVGKTFFWEVAAGRTGIEASLAMGHQLLNMPKSFSKNIARVIIALPASYNQASVIGGLGVLAEVQRMGARPSRLASDADFKNGDMLLHASLLDKNGLIIGRLQVGHSYQVDVSDLADCVFNYRKPMMIPIESQKNHWFALAIFNDGRARGDAKDWSMAEKKVAFVSWEKNRPLRPLGIRNPVFHTCMAGLNDILHYAIAPEEITDAPREQYSATARARGVGRRSLKRKRGAVMSKVSGEHDPDQLESSQLWWRKFSDKKQDADTHSGKKNQVEKIVHAAGEHQDGDQPESHQPEGGGKLVKDVSQTEDGNSGDQLEQSEQTKHIGKLAEAVDDHEKGQFEWSAKARRGQSDVKDVVK